jgi:PAS domain S-box-containing protein
MSDLSPTVPNPLEAENQLLRAEIARLQAEQFQQAVQHGQAERYQQSQIRFRTVFEHSPLGHKIIDADLIVRQANVAVATLLGLDSAQHLLGRQILEFSHPDYKADWARLQKALWDHKLPYFTLETYLVRPNSTSFWCRVTSVLVRDEGGELGYTTLEDISSRKQLEAQTHEKLELVNQQLQLTNEELQEANTHLAHVNAELDMFVYAAAHDLRAPISNLEGLVQALVESLPAGARQAAQVETILGMMQESMVNFRHTLDRLADFGDSYQEEGPTRKQVALDAVVAEVCQELAPLLAATSGEILIDLAGSTSFWSVPKHVHSVVLNLISNALKYRHPDRAPVVRVRSYQELGRLMLSVQDNGLGLNEDQQAQLFRLFKRLHSHVEGTGVGLYLVKKILENAGGSVRVESTLGRGSTFIVEFPT